MQDPRERILHRAKIPEGAASRPGGTHIVERNLTRLTVVVATVFFVNSVILYRLLA